jgi:hypothetical protein
VQPLVRILIIEKQLFAVWMYVDPGSGLLLLQAIGSVVASASIIFRRKIYSLFRRSNRRTIIASDDVPASSESQSKE